MSGNKNRLHTLASMSCNRNFKFKNAFSFTQLLKCPPRPLVPLPASNIVPLSIWFLCTVNSFVELGGYSC